jgi:hypothetical protein
MESLPMAPSCALDDTGRRKQRERYRPAGAGARVVQRSPLLLVVELDPNVDPSLVEETVAIELECCPFYELGWERDRRRLSLSVSHPEHAPALEAIALALGVDAPAAGARTEAGQPSASADSTESAVPPGHGAGQHGRWQRKL